MVEVRFSDSLGKKMRMSPFFDYLYVIISPGRIINESRYGN